MGAPGQGKGPESRPGGAGRKDKQHPKRQPLSSPNKQMEGVNHKTHSPMMDETHTMIDFNIKPRGTAPCMLPFCGLFQ